MKLEMRLTFLFGSLLAIFLGALGALQWAQQHSAVELQTQIAEDKSRQLASLVTLTGSTLERFVADYTQWDEMCAFVASRDPAWAAINLEQSLASWNFHGVWVFGTDTREIYRHLREPFTPADIPAFPSPAVIRKLCGPAPLHFYSDSPRGLLEIRTAPIHPSDDTRSDEPPQGWLVVARHWDTATFTQLGELTDSTVALAAPVAQGNASDPHAQIVTAHPLPDWTGRTLHYLTLRHHSPLLATMIAYDTDEAVFFLLSGLAFLVLAAWFVHSWIRHPLRLIEGSLASDRPELVAPLQKRNDEFARVASLVRNAAEQRIELRREIQDRTYAETELRRAIAERIALGRNLHDGVIQSIYATGMTLQGVVTLLHSNPQEARQRLETCVEGLNRTIAQLRGYIAGLESDTTPAASLAEGLQTLLQELRPVSPIEYDVRLDPALAAAIPQDSIVQLLFIAREAISNALRHSRARHVALQLGTASDEPCFTIEDDGIGFDPAAAGHRGHGLDNMTRRAEEIGASLTIESVPGRGTRLRVELPWNGLKTETPPVAPGPP